MNNCLILPQARKLRDGIIKNIKAKTPVKSSKTDPNVLECGHTRITMYLKEKIQSLKIIPIVELVIRSGCGCQSHTVRMTEADNPEFYDNLADTIKEMDVEYEKKLRDLNKTKWSKFGLTAESLGDISKTLKNKKIHYEIDYQKQFRASVTIPQNDLAEIKRIIRALEQ